MQLASRGGWVSAGLRLHGLPLSAGHYEMTRGRCCCRMTDSRKFVQMGVWKSFRRVPLIIPHVEFRLPVLPRAFFSDVR